MLDETVGSGLVVVGRHGEKAIRAGTLHIACRVNDLSSVVSTCSGKHRRFSTRFFDANLDDAPALFLGKCRTLSSGAARNEKVRALFNLAPREPSNAILIEDAGGGKGGDQCSA